MSKPRPTHSDALYASEREILALYDQGMDASTIAARTGYSLKRVRDTANTLGGRPNPRMEQGIVAGSIALLAALQATGRVHA